MLRSLIKNVKIPRGITHITGPPNSGKTTLLYHMCRGIREGKNALILDCEMNFSAQRLQGIIRNHDINLQNIIVITITNKNQQFQTIMKLHKFLVNGNLNFIAINGITDHFRYTTENDETSSHGILAMQLAFLKMLSEKQKIPVLITNQVSAFREENKRDFRPIANSIIKYYSDRNIILRQVNRRLLKASHENEEVYYTLTTSGIEIKNQ